MKALSVKQPWAGWIAAGIKTIETRTWYTKHRGDLLICSSKKYDEVENYVHVIRSAMEKNLKYDLDGWFMATGYALAIVSLSECRPMVGNDEQKALCPCADGLYSWVLEDIRVIDPIKVKGQRGLFEINTSAEWLL